MLDQNLVDTNVFLSVERFLVIDLGRSIDLQRHSSTNPEAVAAPSLTLPDFANAPHLMSDQAVRQLSREGLKIL